MPSPLSVMRWIGEIWSFEDGERSDRLKGKLLCTCAHSFPVQSRCAHFWFHLRIKCFFVFFCDLAKLCLQFLRHLTDVGIERVAFDNICNFLIPSMDKDWTADGRALIRLCSNQIVFHKSDIYGILFFASDQIRFVCPGITRWSAWAAVVMAQASVNDIRRWECTSISRRQVMKLTFIFSVNTFFLSLFIGATQWMSLGCVSVLATFLSYHPK